MAIEAAGPRPGQEDRAPGVQGEKGASGRPGGRNASRYLPGWARFILALWTICLLLLGFQQLSLFIFMLAGGG